MKWFGLYTLARLGMFAVTFGLVWLVAQFWLDWDAITGLWTALIALAISGPVSYFVLRGLRERTAIEIAERADRAKAAFERRRAAEDDPAPRSEGENSPSEG